MRVTLSLAVAFVSLTSAVAAPLPPEFEEPIYRGQSVDYWIARLKAKDWPTRLDGARALSRARTRAWAAVPALIAALDDEDDDVRTAVMDALGNIGLPAEKALPRLRDVYRRGERPDRYQSLSAMLRIDFRSTQSLASLRHAFRSEDLQARTFALKCAPWLPDLEADEVISAARNSLTHHDKDVRQAASLVLTHYGRAAWPALLEAARATNADTRHDALEILMRLENRRQPLMAKLVDVLQDLLADQSPEAQMLACQRLVELGHSGADVSKALQRGLSSSDAKVRLGAAQGLIELVPGNKADAVAVAAKVLAENSELTDEAVKVLGAAGPAARPALASLLKLARDDHLLALAALAQVGPEDPAVVSALVDALTRPNASLEANTMAAIALRTIGPRAKNHIDDLRRHLSDDLEPPQRTCIADTLVELGCRDEEPVRAALNGYTGSLGDLKRLGMLAASSAEARERLVECLKNIANDRGRGDNDPFSQAALAELLGIGTALTPVLPQLKEVLNSGNPPAQVFTYYLLKKCHPQSIEEADKELLEGKDPPKRGDNTLAQWLKLARSNGRQRRDAILALADFNYPRLTVPVLLEALDDPDESVQADARLVLKNLPAALDQLLAACACDDPEARDRLLTTDSGSVIVLDQIFGVCGHLTGFMADFLEHDNDPRLQLLAARALHECALPFDAVALFHLMQRERSIRLEGAALLASVSYVRGRVDSQSSKAQPVPDFVPLLLSLADDPDIAQRVAAIQALYDIDEFGDDVLELLARTIKSPERKVRQATIAALSRTVAVGTPPWLAGKRQESKSRSCRTTALLAEALDDPLPEIRKGAAEAIGIRGWAGALASRALEKTLEDTNPRVRVAAAAALHKVARRQPLDKILPVLRSALRENSVDVRTEALQILDDMGEDARPVFTEVVALARADRGRLLGNKPLLTLERIDGRPSSLEPVFLEFWKDSGRQDRAQLACLIGKRFGPAREEEIVPYLAELATDDSNPFSRPALHLLLNLHVPHPEAMPALLANFRSVKLRSLSWIPDQQGARRDMVAFLYQQSCGPDPLILLRCFDSLPSLGAEAEPLLPLLQKLVDLGELEPRQFFHIAQRMDLTEKSVPALTKLLRTDPEYAATACQMLGRLGPAASEAVPALESLLEHQNRDLATEACRALFAIKREPSLEMRNALLQMRPRRVLTMPLDDRQVSANLNSLGSELHPVLQSMVEMLRDEEDDREISDFYAQRFLQFAAGTGDHVNYVLPELFELQRDLDAPCLWLPIPSEEVLGRNHSYTSWASGSRRPISSPVEIVFGHSKDGAKALRELLQKNPAAAMPIIARYLKDPDPRLRASAATCARVLGPQAAECARDLQNAIQNRQGLSKQDKALEEFYLIQLLHALVEVGFPKDNVKAVVPLLKDERPRVQSAAIWALSQPGADAEAARSAFADIPDDAAVEVCLEKTLALVRLRVKMECAAQRLDSFLQNDKREVRLQAAAGLCELGAMARPSMDTFVKWAKGPDYLERVLAAEAHWTIASQSQAAMSLCIGIMEYGEHAADAVEVIRLIDRLGPDAETASRLRATRGMRTRAR